jgi:alpha-beta hydrolase superfamily lysophospholipase
MSVPEPPAELLAARSLRRVLRGLVLAATWVVVALASLVLLRAFDARRLPPLAPCHLLRTPLEYRAGRDGGLDWAGYLERESELFADLERRLAAATHASAEDRPFDRHVRGSRSDPARQARDWNRSFVLEPEGEPVGGVLALHGLSDSPYSVRAFAERLAAEGHLVLAPRLPGHGTIPAALVDVEPQDWLAVVDLAFDELARRVGPDRPVHVLGYSNGATLALRDVLARLEDGRRVPERLVLVSPALGITRLAVFADWHETLAWMPWFEQFRWQAVVPEFDPFKYNSFPKAAGGLSHRVTGELAAEVRRSARDGRLERLPPVLAIQSVVDATVVTRDVLDRLFDHLEDQRHELLLFDVNRASAIEGFLRPGRAGLGLEIAARPSRPWRFTLWSGRRACTRCRTSRCRSRPTTRSTVHAATRPADP